MSDAHRAAEADASPPPFPMKHTVDHDCVSLYRDPRQSGNALFQFHAAVARIVERAVAEDRARRVAPPTNPAGARTVQSQSPIDAAKYPYLAQFEERGLDLIVRTKKGDTLQDSWDVFESVATAIVERAVAEDRAKRTEPTVRPEELPTACEGGLETCPRCKGSRENPAFDPSFYDGEPYRCPRCKGVGVVLGEPSEPEPSPRDIYVAPPSPTPRDRLRVAVARTLTDEDFVEAARMLKGSFRNADLQTLTFVLDCLAGRDGGGR